LARKILIFLCQKGTKINYFTHNTSKIFWEGAKPKQSPFPDHTPTGEGDTPAQTLHPSASSAPRCRPQLFFFLIRRLVRTNASVTK